MQPSLIVAILLAGASLSSTAGFSKANSVEARASLTLAILHFLGAVPAPLQRNAFHFIVSEQRSPLRLDEIGKETALISAETMVASLEAAGVEPEEAEARMGAVTERLRGALEPGQYADVKAAYNAAQRRLFDAGAIERFAHTTTRELGMASGTAFDDLAGPEYAEYSVMRLRGREYHVLSGHHRNPQLLSIFDAQMKPQMAADPGRSLALVEGRLTDAPEAAAMSREAHEWGIPTFDPVINLFQKAVNVRYLSTHQEEKLASIYADLVFLYTYARGKTEPNDIDHFLRFAEIHSELAFSTLERAVKSRALKLRQNAKYLTEYFARHGAYAGEALEISNILSQQALRWALRRYPDRDKIFVYLGAGHLPILGPKTGVGSPGVSPKELHAIIGQRDRHTLVLALEEAKFDVDKHIHSALPEIERIARYVFESEFTRRDYQTAFFYRTLRSIAIIRLGLDRERPYAQIAAEAESGLSFASEPEDVDAAYRQLERILLTMSAHTDILVEIVASKYRKR